jgi:hypothetical protein
MGEKGGRSSKKLCFCYLLDGEIATLKARLRLVRVPFFTPPLRLLALFLRRHQTFSRITKSYGNNLLMNVLKIENQTPLGS